MSVKERRISAPAGEIYAKSWAGATPQGAPLILLHDSIGCTALWRDFPAELARRTGRQVIAYDRLGYGQSSIVEGLPPLDFIAREAVTTFPLVAEAYGAERFALYGYSVGGEMSLEIAAAYPERCEAVIAVSAQAFVEDRTLEGVRAARVAYAEEAQLSRLRRYHGPRAEWSVAAWTELWLDPAFAEWSIDAAAARTVCPVLAIHGEEDEFGSVAFPKRIVEKVAGPSEMLLLPGVGHVPHREATEEVLSAVAGFLG